MRSAVTWTMLAALATGCPKKDDTGGSTADTGSVPTEDSGTVTDSGTPEPTTPFSAFQDADLTDGNTVRSLAILSAEQMYVRAFLTAFATNFGSDPKCPLIDYPSPYETTVVGGCTSTQGIEWTGAAVYISTMSGDLTVTYSDGFGYLGQTSYCGGVGYVDLDQALTGTIFLGVDGSFSVSLSGLYTELDQLTCLPEARNFVLDYAGTFQQVKVDDRYGGAGEYGDDRHGHVTAETSVQLETAVGCAWEADGGSTLLSTPDHVATITYDGATDCDKVGTAMWSLDGLSQGELIGIGCSSTPGALGWIGLVPLLLAVRRRRGAGAWLALVALVGGCQGDDDTTTKDSSAPTEDTATPPPTTPPTVFDGYEHADLTDPSTVRALTHLSAVQQYVRPFVMLQVALSYGDKTCPALTGKKLGTTSYALTITGDCTDISGVEWFGTAEYVTSDKGVVFTQTGFGIDNFLVPCYPSGSFYLSARIDGVFAQTEIDAFTKEYTSSMSGLLTEPDFLTCTGEERNFVLEYAGTLFQGYNESQYDGSGRYADDVYGLVDVSTFAQQQTYPSCYTEVDAGVTVLSTPDHEVGLSYDGVTDCDDPGTVAWSLDGSPQGEILGVSCSSTAATFGWLTLVPLLAVRRRVTSA